VSTKTSHRTKPLAAAPLGQGNGNGHTPTVDDVVHVPHPVGDAPAEQARRRRFADGIRDLRVGSSLNLGERTLMVVGGVLAPLGLIVVLLGWWGASQTPFVFEQVPYLISGGLLGLGLVFLGAFFYFTHWLTQLVKEHRTQSAAVVDALQRLQDQILRLGDGQLGPGGSVAPASAHLADEGAAVVLVATAHGTMAHRPDCVVVAGKDDLRRVDGDASFTLCKLCNQV